MPRLSVTLIALTLVAPAALATGAGAASPPDHQVLITGLSGSTITTWPPYSADVSRFALASDDPASGVSVHVTSSESDARIRVDGRTVANGQQLALPDVRPGDEVNIQVTDSSGTSNQSWIYLPPGFPALATEASGAGPAPGMTGLTLRSGAGDSWTTVVDAHGVPSYVMTRDKLTADFNRQPNDHYSVAVASTEDLYSDWTIEEYDEQFQRVATHHMVGHPKTDFHDAILLSGGGRILMSYIKAQDGQTDSWLQEVAPNGQILLDWNSRDHMDRVNDPILNALGDYAHLNSIQVMSDGNLLLSFRHLNQVMKIDRTTGAVIWRLGGRRSDFEFVDDALGGPCAQHTARELANGDIQIFDNGSGSYPQSSNPLCPERHDPEAGVYRSRSRVTVYRLDPSAGQATLVQELDTGAFSQFAGSAQRLGANSLDDHVLVGLNNAWRVDDAGDAPDAIELDASGDVVWSLTAPGVATYRAEKFAAPDRIAPDIDITAPIDGAVLLQGHRVTADFGCTDRGGSNLEDCGTTSGAAALSDAVGTHQLAVRATDRAGNVTTRSVTYTVVAPGSPMPPPAQQQPPMTTTPGGVSSRADAMIRRPGSRWKGRGVFDVSAQTITAQARRGSPATALVRVRNAGPAARRLRLEGSARGRGVTVRWYDGGRDVTRLLDGGFRTPRLEPGASVRLRVVVTVAPRASAGTKTVRLLARARGDVRADIVRLHVGVA